MTSLRNIAFVLLAVSLVACINISNPKQVKTMPLDQLCEGYYFGRQPSVNHDTSWPTKQTDIKKELDRRAAVTADDWALIDQGKIQTGMSECALRAAWGYPIRIARTVNGDADHYIYSSVRDAYVADGKVTKFQY